MRTLASIIALFFITVVALSGCGGDSGCGRVTGSSSTSTSTCGGSTTTTKTASKVAVTSSAATVPPDGSSSATITAVVTDSTGAAISGATVTLTATAGTLSSASGTTDANGKVTTTLSASGVGSGTGIVVTATDGSVSGNVTVTVASGSSSGGGTNGVASLTAMTSAGSILADGSTTATITVLARDSNNNLMSGVTVAFAATSGGLAVTQAITDASGAAKATLSTAGDSTIRTITVTATVATLKATAQVQVVASSSASTTTVASLVLTSNTAYILSDGSTNATISALARDAANNALSGVPVTFTASSGALQVVKGTTDATGTATATLTTGGDSTSRTITVTGTTATLSSTANVNVQPPAVYTMGNGTGSGFTKGVIGLTTSGTLSAGGTVGFQVTIVDQNNTLYTGGTVTVTFNSPCIASANAQILPGGSSTPSTTVTTATGSLSATYVAKGCSGTDAVSATATIGTGAAAQSLSATTTLTIASATSGSIQFVSATPASIGLKGTGLNETSTVIFKVLDTSGGAKAGVTVNFALDTNVGGLTLSPGSAVSASDGTVQTVVNAGTVHTTVRVTASITSPALSTQSSQLNVTTGLPASKPFSIAVGPATYANGPSPLACPNVEAWSINNISVPFTVSLADRYNNPVPAGTAVTFYTNGGHIVGSCTTPTLAGTAADGTCSVIWTSNDPRPMTTDTPPVLRNGRAQVFATVIGEESFTDSAATGFYQTGDWFDNLGEPFLSANESLNYVLNDHYLDFNNNGTRDGPSGSFIGITCTGTSPGSTCSTSTLALGVSHLIIMSTSNANLGYVSSPGFTGGPCSTNTTATPWATSCTNPLAITHGGSGSIVFHVEDQNGNAMAAGTVISATADTTVGTATVSGGITTIGCDADIGGQNFTISFSSVASLSGGVAQSGNVGIKVVSPSGSVTVLSVPVVVN